MHANHEPKRVLYDRVCRLFSRLALADAAIALGHGGTRAIAFGVDAALPQ